MADTTLAPEPTAIADANPVSDRPETDARPTQQDPSSTPLPPIPNPNPSGVPPPSVIAPPPPAIQPSFRPAGQPVPVPSAVATPQFSPVTYQLTGVPPPGVVVASAPLVGSGQQMQVPVMAQAYSMAGQPIRYGPPMPNGYPGIPQPLPQGAMPPVSS